VLTLLQKGQERNRALASNILFPKEGKRGKGGEEDGEENKMPGAFRYAASLSAWSYLAAETQLISLAFRGEKEKREGGKKKKAQRRGSGEHV